ncbi:MAG: diaminopimelate decarboxylase [Rhodothermales bacterium]
MSTPFRIKEPADAPRLLEAAARFGTPLYVYDERIIRRQCQALRTHLAGLPLRLLYAMKANEHPAVLRVIRDEGFGIDAVSPGELELALRVGFSPDDILYSANNITDAEMREIAEQGILMNIGELSRLEALGQSFPGARVCIRMNPSIGSGHHQHVVTAGKHTKFGVPIEAIDELLAIAGRHRLRIVGIHQHIGSGIASMAVLWQAMQMLLDAAPRFPDLAFINFGGGFNIPYRAEDEALDLENFQAGIVDPLLARLPDGLTCWFEPGRFLTAEAGTLVVSATTIKEAYGVTYAGTDSGMAHLIRPAMYGAYHEIVNLSHPDGALDAYTVVGNICESGDVLARDRQIREIRPGDVLAIMDAGAYGMAMASLYNLRPLPGEAMIRANGAIELIQPRWTPTQLIDTLYGGYLGS